MVWKICIKIYQKRHHKKVQQQKELYVSSNLNQLSGKHKALRFIPFSFPIEVDLFAAKIAGYAFIYTRHETKTSTYLWTISARILL